MFDPAMDLSVIIRSPGPVEVAKVDQLSVRSASSEQPLVEVSVVSAEQALRSDQAERRTMVVGSGVSLSGDVNLCDRLIISGTLEASIHEGRELEILPTSVFRGNATVMTADIRGRFEGDLEVRKRLIVRSTGHVAGSITYREMAVEAGAEVAGILMPDRTS
jgi:cytoskeletal protein CcmA (bactofilin family)